MNFVSMLNLLVSSMLIYAAPLVFTSIGGALSEHSGVVNVGLEGIMVMGAFSGVVFNLTFESTSRLSMQSLLSTFVLTMLSVVQF